jgi:hypothetical protein
MGMGSSAGGGGMFTAARGSVDSPLIHVCQEMHQAILHHWGGPERRCQTGIIWQHAANYIRVVQSRFPG